MLCTVNGPGPHSLPPEASEVEAGTYLCALANVRACDELDFGTNLTDSFRMTINGIDAMGPGAAFRVGDRYIHHLNTIITGVVVIFIYRGVD